MRASLCRPHELTTGEISTWRSLQSRASDTDSPFLSPEFALAAGRWRSDVRVAIFEQNDELVAFWAFTLSPRGVAGPVAPGFSDVQGIVQHEEFPLERTSILKACGLRGWSFDHLIGWEARQLAGGASFDQSPFIDLSEGWAGYQSWASRAHARSFSTFARQQRKLRRNLGSERFESYLGDGTMLDTVLTMKSEQCQRNGWQDPFKSGWARDLLMDLASTASPGLTGVISVLRAGNRVIAADFGLRSQSTHAIWIGAFDSAYREYSPGILLVQRTAQEAAATGARLVDLGKGLEDWKARLGNGEREVATGAVHRGGLLPAVTTLPNVAEHRIRRFFEHNESAARAIHRVRTARRRTLRPAR